MLRLIFTKACSVLRADLASPLGRIFFPLPERITPEQNTIMEQPFSEEEIKMAVFSSYSDGAPGPDGLSFMFYQRCWEIVKADILALFRDFYFGNLDLYRLNFAVLTLIPKEPDADRKSVV